MQLNKIWETETIIFQVRYIKKSFRLGSFKSYRVRVCRKRCKLSYCILRVLFILFRHFYFFHIAIAKPIFFTHSFLKVEVICGLLQSSQSKEFSLNQKIFTVVDLENQRLTQKISKLTSCNSCAKTWNEVFKRLVFKCLRFAFLRIQSKWVSQCLKQGE